MSSNIKKIKGYLLLSDVTINDVANLAGVAYKTASGVLCGHGKSKPVRKAVIELARFKNPKIAKKIENLWPEGTKLVK